MQDHQKISSVHDVCQALREELTKYYEEEVEPLKRENEELKLRIIRLERQSTTYRETAARLKRERDWARARRTEE